MGSNASRKKLSGFTLIELLVVISIIGMLASVVLVSLGSTRQKASQAGGLIFATNNYQALGADAWAMFDFNDTSATLPKDVSGNNRATGMRSGATYTTSTLTPTGSGRSFSPSAANGGFYFTTDSNPINSPSGNCASASLPLACVPSSYTASAWIYPTGLSGNSNKYIIVSPSSANNSLVLYITISNGVPSAVCYGYFSSGSFVCANISVPVDQWTQLTATYSLSAQALTLYVNGTIAADVSSAQAVPSRANNESNTISVGSNNTLFKFQGSIDDVAIYGRSLTAAQVHEIYAQGLPEHSLAKAR